MRSSPTRPTLTSGRQHKRRRLLVVGLLGAIGILLCVYGTSLAEDNTLQSVAEATASHQPAMKDIQFAWPAGVQAAIGSVEDGLLGYSSANETPQPTASIAKVITALAIMEKQPFKLGQAGKTYVLTAHDVANYTAEAAKGGSALPVYEGMVVTQYQALQMMLIASANNMADTLVERTFGSEEAYVSYAQKMLQRIGLRQTVIADASGFNPATVSTPSELVAIGIAALQNPVIADIVAQPQAQIPDVGVITNTNELLGDDGTIGIKTGTTNQAGSCLLFAARSTVADGRPTTIVGVVMGGTDAASLFSDSRALLASAKQNVGLDGTNRRAATSNLE